MKNTFRIIGMAMMAVFLSLSLAACGSDDEPSDPETHDKNLVGTWVSSYETEDYVESTTVEFKANGSFRLDFYYKDDEETEKGWVKGNWETEEGLIHVSITGSSDNMGYDEVEFTSSYYIKGKKLYLDGEEFTRK